MSGNERGSETRQRILDAACEVFSASGYDGTSVRQIVETAGTNLASINYHFGNKEALYKEVVEQTFSAFRMDFGSVLEELHGTAPSDDYLRSFAKQRIAAGFQSRHGFPPRLLGWEILSPKCGTETLFENQLAATEEQIATLLAPLFAPEMPATQRFMIARWFFAAILPPPPVVTGMWHVLGPEPDEEAVDRVAAQLAEAALAGVKALIASYGAIGIAATP